MRRYLLECRMYLTRDASQHIGAAREEFDDGKDKIRRAGSPLITTLAESDAPRPVSPRPGNA